MAAQEERRALWLLAEVVEFEGKRYRAVLTPTCAGCVHERSEDRCMKFKAALEEATLDHICGPRIWKRAK